MSDFEPSSIPLFGRHLIEASAGTGKTHALTDLYLRLILERPDLDITGILVLTFTNAAAAELRDRLRLRLVRALSCLRTNELACDPVLARVVADRHHLQRRLGRALSGFDAAPVGTIHSFCLRVLQEHPVECGVALGVCVVPSSADLESALVREVAHQLFGDAASPAAGELTLIWACQYLGKRSLASIVREARTGLVRIVPDIPSSQADATVLEHRFFECLDRARSLWAKLRDDLYNLLLAAPLPRNRYGPDQLRRRFETAEVWLAAPSPPDPRTGATAFTTLAPNALRAAARKGHADKIPSHPLLEALGELEIATTTLAQAARACATALRVRAAHLAPTIRRQRLDRMNAVDYDDLTLRVLDALRAPSGVRLANQLAQEYRVALVDEAQDTDPAQNEILDILHAHGTALFFIGDPKQSIYAFRGADLFAYARMASHAQRHSLRYNWRATPSLVKAIQTVFARPHAFGWPFIPVPEVHPAKDATTLELQLNGHTPPPFRIWLDSPVDGARIPIPAGRARGRIAERVAADIAALLAPNCGARLVSHDDARAVEPADIAVLVTRHLEAADMLAALVRAGVPAATSSQASVFASDDALQLRILLDALAQPRREDLARGAALTTILAIDPHTLADPSSAAWATFMEHWISAAELWPRRGICETLERLFAVEAVYERLLARPDGERHATNLRHLTDLLGAAEAERRMSPAALLAWFDAQISASDMSTEETELQLDSDACRVRIATIHHSKGLQYPIVYCPFLWTLPHTGRDVTDIAVYHDETTGERILDVGGPELEAHVERARYERFLESVRLTYVAVTRARAACTVVWGPFRNAAASPLAWLWHAHADDEPGRIVQAVHEWDLPRIEADLAALTRAAAGTIIVGPPPEIEEIHFGLTPIPPELGPPRRCRRSLDDTWRIASFSSLRAGGSVPIDVVERPDADLATRLPPNDPALEPCFHLPAGPAVGSVLHELLESVDFAHATRDRLVRKAAETLSLHGLDPSWADTIADLVLAALSTPLNDDGLRLCDLDPRHCMREVPFLMRLGPITAEQFNKQLGRIVRADLTYQRPAPLVFEPMHGFLKGFIDLVFEADGRWYLLDYKSNLVGLSPDDYGPERLATVMREADYELQALIYAVALHRFALTRGVSQAEFAERWGGCLYVFLRGLSLATGPTRGVVHWRPSPEELAELSTFLDRGGMS